MRTYGVIACPGCGNSITKTSPNMKRCKPCALAAHGETKSGLRERVCVLCKSTYKPTGTHQKACPDCADTYKSQKNKEHLTRLRQEKGAIPLGSILQCAECGDDFEYSSGPQRRCKTCQRDDEVSKIRKWLKANPEKVAVYHRAAMDNYHFDGNRRKALERDAYTCQHCGTHDDLHVHHIDGKGTTTPRELRNNALDNLMTLCRSCHTRLHAAERASL